MMACEWPWKACAEMSKTVMQAASPIVLSFPWLVSPDLKALYAVDVYRTKLNDTFSARFAECEVSTWAVR